jgi:GNAT superfamily N-acetyltransferase
MNVMSDLTPAIKDEKLGTWMPDGSLRITAEQLAVLGNGDAKRGRRELRLLLASEQDRSVPSGPAVKPATVRIATIADEPAIFDLIMMDLDENATHIAPIDTDQVIRHIHVATRQQGGIMGVIDGPEGTPIGLVLLVPEQWWWSRAYYVQEKITYVHPDHRGAGHIHDLLQFARWTADIWTASFGYRIFMLCGVLGTKRIREKMILYRRKFRAVGMAFLYPPPPEV